MDDDEQSVDEKGKSPLQASGKGRPSVRDDGVGTATTHGRSQSESQGGAYPNPHTGKGSSEDEEKFHGGQSGAAYHGTGQLGESEAKGPKNLNSTAKDG
ncbi:hypothetical protein [uncultured Novosphingobium sp.]|uniref:hypothetical protein n=1 Tax=uncultured Novosphingobium sp. TaxID=292277 RepID=UPI0025895909|nr:hypothetical protein [uncultured Novosphingobium sp.]